MNRDLFLRDLRNELTPLTLNEQEQIIDEYLSIFDFKREEGMSDEEIIKELGNPRDIANQFLNEFNIDNNEFRYSQSAQPHNEERRIGLFVFMIIFDVFIGFWLFFSAVVTLFSIAIASVAMIVASPFTFFLSIGVSLLGSFSVFCLILGVGLLLLALSISLSRLLFIGIVKHINWLKSLL